MSYYDYNVSRSLADKDYPFDALIMAAMRKADSVNLFFLSDAFPETYKELRARYNAPGGFLNDTEMELYG